MEFKAKRKTASGGKPSSMLVLRDDNYIRRDFSNQNIGKLTVVNCSFDRCSFAGTTIGQANFGAGGMISTYTDCSFSSARISAASPGNALFKRCSFEDVEISEFIGLLAQFVGCTFSGSLKGCVFQGAVPSTQVGTAGRTQNQFSGNDFSRAVFEDVDFRAGVDLLDQDLPSDSNYRLISNAEEFLQQTRERFLSEKDLSLRENVFSLLNILKYSVDEGQKQLFISSDDFPEALRTTLNFVLEEDGGAKNSR